MNIFTDEDIKEIVGPWGDTPIKGYTRSLFDKIEAKLREKQEVNTLRDAAQQALGALYIAQDDCVHGEMAEPSPIFGDAITALEAALAEPEPTNQLPPMPEPVAWQVIDRLGKERNAPLFAEWQMRSYAQVAIDLAAPPQRQPEPQPQSTHSADCYKWHHKCAIAEVERLRAHGIGSDK